MNLFEIICIMFSFIIMGICFGITISYGRIMSESYKKALTSLQKTIESNSQIITTISLYLEGMYNEQIERIYKDNGDSEKR